MSNRQYTGPMRLRSAHTARGGDRGVGVRVGVRGCDRCDRCDREAIAFHR
ncbi:MAG: hypothetical protein GDA43_24365 [Hormoscilla sp. SP5CHS1]|nr:hypothetical protein [Hormoscilla sp. SP5CHS1]